MSQNQFLSLIFCITFFAGAHAQKIATLEVEVAKPASGLQVPVRVNLDAITFLSDTLLSLVEVRPKGSYGGEGVKIPTPFQIENGTERTLHWTVVSPNDKIKKYVYELVKGPAAKNSGSIATKVEDGTLTIHTGSKNLLRYQFKTAYPPAGVDTAFKRSGFIHPLWTPNGQPLTRIQAPDHYHHYGIWNPWTHVLFEGDTVDFWNLKARKGTVRFGHFVSITSGAAYAEYQALHEHVVFKKGGEEKVALNELQTVRVYNPEKDQDHYIVDITIRLNCASESPFRILEYRYAGLGWRATEKWNKDNSEVLTSEGKSRKGADGTTARWCIVQGALEGGYGGAVMMSHPANYNHPEPLRIWPEDSNGGEMFAMFAPTKTRDWLLKPYQIYTLKYRFVVFNDRFTSEKAEREWHYYNAPPKVVVKMN